MKIKCSNCGFENIDIISDYQHQDLSNFIIFKYDKNIPEHKDFIDKKKHIDNNGIQSTVYCKDCAIHFKNLEIKRLGKVQIKVDSNELINKVSELEKEVVQLKKEIGIITNIKKHISDSKLEKDSDIIAVEEEELNEVKNEELEKYSFKASKELKEIITHRIRSGELKFESKIPQSPSSIIYNPHIEEGDKFHLTVYINGKNWENLHWTYKDKHFQFNEDLIKKLGIKVDSRWATQIQTDWKNSVNEFIEEGVINYL